MVVICIDIVGGVKDATAQQVLAKLVDANFPANIRLRTAHTSNLDVDCFGKASMPPGSILSGGRVVIGDNFYLSFYGDEWVIITIHPINGEKVYTSGTCNSFGWLQQKIREIKGFPHHNNSTMQPYRRAPAPTDAGDGDDDEVRALAEQERTEKFTERIIASQLRTEALINKAKAARDAVTAEEEKKAKTAVDAENRRAAEEEKKAKAAVDAENRKIYNDRVNLLIIMVFFSVIAYGVVVHMPHHTAATTAAAVPTTQQVAACNVPDMRMEMFYEFLRSQNQMKNQQQADTVRELTPTEHAAMERAAVERKGAKPDEGKEWGLVVPFVLGAICIFFSVYMVSAFASFTNNMYNMYNMS